MIEQWRPIVGYEGYYEVSDRGRVRSVDRVIVQKNGQAHHLKGRIRATRPDRRFGYEMLRLQKNGKPKTCKVHTLVLTAFIGPRPEGYHGCHGDGDQANNCLSNLRWDTPSGNGKDTVRHGRNTWANRTACSNGHPYVAGNFTQLRDKRECLVCRRERHARRHPPRAPKTHCQRGHEFTLENTRVEGGRRHCRRCQRIHWLRYYRAHRARPSVPPSSRAVTEGGE